MYDLFVPAPKIILYSVLRSVLKTERIFMQECCHAHFASQPLETINFGFYFMKAGPE
jgi:hypothetical protein